MLNIFKVWNKLKGSLQRKPFRNLEEGLKFPFMDPNKITFGLEESRM